MDSFGRVENQVSIRVSFHRKTDQMHGSECESSPKRTLSCKLCHVSFVNYPHSDSGWLDAVMKKVMSHAKEGTGRESCGKTYDTTKIDKSGKAGAGKAVKAGAGLNGAELSRVWDLFPAPTPVGWHVYFTPRLVE